MRNQNFKGNYPNVAVGRYCCLRLRLTFHLRYSEVDGVQSYRPHSPRREYFLAAWHSNVEFLRSDWNKNTKFTNGDREVTETICLLVCVAFDVSTTADVSTYQTNP